MVPAGSVEPVGDSLREGPVGPAQHGQEASVRAVRASSSPSATPGAQRVRVGFDRSPPDHRPGTASPCYAGIVSNSAMGSVLVIGLPPQAEGNDVAAVGRPGNLSGVPVGRARRRLEGDVRAEPDAEAHADVPPT